MDFFYDSNGNAYALKYNGILYYYITNLQGDVMSIVDAQGAVVASYNYDPYGNLISDELAENTVGHLNPLRYRAYYYDSESELYYLQSRYYDPEVGRFLNADVMYDTDVGLQGYDLFAYCGSNPVNRIDTSGTTSERLDDLDLDDDQVAERGGGGNGSHGGGSTWTAFKATMCSASSGLQMATGAHVGFERHHFLSNKNSTYTPQYEAVTARYNAELEQPWNTEHMSGHRGRHTNAYHDFMLQMLYEIDYIAQGDPRLFHEGFSVLKDYVLENPWITYAK